LLATSFLFLFQPFSKRFLHAALALPSGLSLVGLGTLERMEGHQFFALLTLQCVHFLGQALGVVFKLCCAAIFK